MKVIWKYEIGGDYTCEMPEGATVLSVGEQHGRVCLWAEVESRQVPERRRFVTVGTEIAFPEGVGDRLAFLGTVPMYGGEIILHVFEVRA
jgi:hypothetical protein